MQYAAHLPSTRDLLVPVVALAIGAAGAVGIYSALDETDVSVQPTRVVISEPVQPGAGTSAKNEAGTASAIGGTQVNESSFGKDEAGTASAIGAGSFPTPDPQTFGKDEAGTAASIGGSQPRDLSQSERQYLNSHGVGAPNK
jgi:hypothetical protein